MFKNPKKATLQTPHSYEPEFVDIRVMLAQNDSTLIFISTDYIVNRLMVQAVQRLSNLRV